MWHSAPPEMLSGNNACYVWRQKFVADSSELGHFSRVPLSLVVVVVIRAPTSIFMEQLRDSGGGGDGGSIGIGKEDDIAASG